MKRHLRFFSLLTMLLFLISCSAGYRAQPLPFRPPNAYSNAQDVAGATIAAKAYLDHGEASEAFGYNIRGAGMLPVQVIFDNQGAHYLEIIAAQTFLEDREGNLWPILPSDIAYDRAARFAQTNEIFKEAAYHGILGALAGAVIGAAIGVVSGQDVAKAMGRGAAVGAAGGSVIGGAKGYDSVEAGRAVIDDLRQKSLQAKPIAPKNMSYGVIFFPGEAKSARLLRLQIRETDTDKTHVLLLRFP